MSDKSEQHQFSSISTPHQGCLFEPLLSLASDRFSLERTILNILTTSVTKVATRGDSTPSSQKAGRFEEKKLLAVSKSEGILWKLKGCKFMKC